ncbi:MAG: hypothetical protein IPN04_07200 [Rhodoferax sp.]|nr:hypothetical protein [Rhodoferax sp.]
MKASRKALLKAIKRQAQHSANQWQLYETIQNQTAFKTCPNIESTLKNKYEDYIDYQVINLSIGIGLARGSKFGI